MVKMSKIKATTDSTILHTCPCILIINIITTQHTSSNLTYSLATDIIITILKMTKNYYRILELPENCNNEQIKKAYRKLAMQHHPVHTPLYRIKIQIAKKKPKKNSHKLQKPMQYSQTHRKEQLMIEMETPQNNNIHSHNDLHTPETNMHGNSEFDPNFDHFANMPEHFKNLGMQPPFKFFEGIKDFQMFNSHTWFNDHFGSFTFEMAEEVFDKAFKNFEQ